MHFAILYMANKKNKDIKGRVKVFLIFLLTKLQFIKDG